MLRLVYDRMEEVNFIQGGTDNGIAWEISAYLFNGKDVVYYAHLSGHPTKPLGCGISFDVVRDMVGRMMYEKIDHIRAYRDRPARVIEEPVKRRNFISLKLNKIIR